MDKYPECEKMVAVSDESQSIGSFIDWLAEAYGSDRAMNTIKAIVDSKTLPQPTRA